MNLAILTMLSMHVREPQSPAYENPAHANPYRRQFLCRSSFVRGSGHFATVVRFANLFRDFTIATPLRVSFNYVVTQ